MCRNWGYVNIGDVCYRCQIDNAIADLFFESMYVCSKSVKTKLCIDVVCNIHSKVEFYDCDFGDRQEPKYTSYGLIREICDIGCFKYYRQDKKIVADCMIPSEYILDPIEVIVDTIVQFMHLSMIDYGMLPIHAAVVNKDNRGIIILGNSGAGKSTTEIALLQNGGSFFSDDGVFVDKDLLLHANMVNHISYTKGTAELANKVWGANLEFIGTQKNRRNMPLEGTCLKPSIMIFPEKNSQEDRYAVELISAKDVLTRLVQYHVSKEYSQSTKIAYWLLFKELSKQVKGYSFKWAKNFDCTNYLQAIEKILLINQCEERTDLSC